MSCRNVESCSVDHRAAHLPGQPNASDRARRLDGRDIDKMHGAADPIGRDEQVTGDCRRPNDLVMVEPEATVSRIDFFAGGKQVVPPWKTSHHHDAPEATTPWNLS